MTKKNFDKNLLRHKNSVIRIFFFINKSHNIIFKQKIFYKKKFFITKEF